MSQSFVKYDNGNSLLKNGAVSARIDDTICRSLERYCFMCYKRYCLRAMIIYRIKFCPSSLVEQKFLSIFLPKAIFDFIRIKPVRVADERKMAGESSLTPAVFVSADRTAIGQFILMESIFHLLLI